MLSARERDLAGHTRRVVLEKCKMVTEDKKFWSLEFPLGGLSQRVRGLPETVQEDIVESETSPGE